MGIAHGTWRRVVDIAQVVGAIAAIVGILVGVYVAYSSSTMSPEITYSFSPTSTIVAVGPEAESVARRIQILFDNQPVPSVYLVQARISNTGRLPLKREAIRQPFVFVFGPGVRLLTWQIVGTDPENLDAKLNDVEGQVELDIDLLNPGETVYTQFVYTGAKATPQVLARIEGAKELKRGAWETKLISVPGLGSIEKSFGSGFVTSLLLVFWLQTIRYSVYKVARYWSSHSPNLQSKPSDDRMILAVCIQLALLVIVIVLGGYLTAWLLRVWV